MNGIDNYIEACEPGGIAGWLSTLHATRADAFLGGVMLGRRQGLLLDDFQKHFRTVKAEGWPVFYLRRNEG